MVFFDLDYFKVINDTYGHDVGDQTIIAAANRLQEATGKQDIVARLAELRKSYPHAFIEGEISDAKIIQDREEPLAITEETLAEKDTLPTD